VDYFISNEYFFENKFFIIESFINHAKHDIDNEKIIYFDKFDFSGSSILNRNETEKIHKK